MLSHRTHWLVILLCAVIALGTVGWVVAEGIVDPAQQGQRDGEPIFEVVTSETLTIQERALAKGETFEVRLEGNPTTGYLWEVVENDDQIIRVVADEYLTGDTTGRLCGAGGRYRFQFKAMGRGETTVKLVYHRPWEKDVEPLQTYLIDLTVN